MFKPIKLLNTFLTFCVLVRSWQSKRGRAMGGSDVLEMRKPVSTETYPRAVEIIHTHKWPNAATAVQTHKHTDKMVHLITTCVDRTNTNEFVLKKANCLAGFCKLENIIKLYNG